MNLNALREEIDIIDRQIVELLDARVAVVKDIGDLKKRSGTAIHDPNREQKVLNTVASLVKNMPQADIREIYSLIMKLSKALQ